MLIPRPRYKRTPSKLEPHPKTMTVLEAVNRGLIQPNPNSQLARDLAEAIERNNARTLRGSDQNKTPTQHAGDAFDTNGRTL